METKNASVTTRPGAKPAGSVAPLPAMSGKPKALDIMASRVNVDPAKLIAALRATCFRVREGTGAAATWRSATDEECLALVVVANEYGLNPFLKEIYAFPAKAGGGIVPVIGVDGWIKMINRAPEYDGVQFAFEFGEDEKGKFLISCTCTLHVKNRKFPIIVTEYLSECERDTDQWQKMPCRMLRHKALIQAGRVAFGFAGISDEDEAIDVAATTIDIEAAGALGSVKELPRTVEASEEEKAAMAKEVKQDKERPATESPRHQMETLLFANGFTFQDLIKWGEETGNIPDASSLPDMSAIKEEILTRLLRARAGLINGIKALKG